MARRFRRNAALAYLLGEDELNQDNSNYFIFSESGLRVMLGRAHWQIHDYVALGDTSLSDPVHAEHDERAFCLLRSTHERLREPGTAGAAGTRAKRPDGAGRNGNSPCGCAPPKAPAR